MRVARIYKVVSFKWLVVRTQAELPLTTYHLPLNTLFEYQLGEVVQIRFPFAEIVASAGRGEELARNVVFL